MEKKLKNNQQGSNAGSGAGASTDPARLMSSPRIADARASIRHVFVRDLLLDCLVGVYKHERDQPQRVLINLDMAVYEGQGPLDDDIGSVVCYEKAASDVRALADRGHVPLVESFAEEIAALCLTDRRVRSVIVRVEKLDALTDAGSVGVEIERFNQKV